MPIIEHSVSHISTDSVKSRRSYAPEVPFYLHYAVIMNYQRYFLTKITLLISKWKPGPGPFSEE